MLLAGGLGLAACGGGDGADPIAEAPAAPGGDPVLTRGRSLYISYCAECHGLDGRGRTTGRVAPSLRSVAQRMTLPQQLELIRLGRGLMPAMELPLDPGEREAVALYERSVF